MERWGGSWPGRQDRLGCHYSAQEIRPRGTQKNRKASIVTRWHVSLFPWPDGAIRPTARASVTFSATSEAFRKFPNSGKEDPFPSQVLIPRPSAYIRSEGHHMYPHGQAIDWHFSHYIVIVLSRRLTQPIVRQQFISIPSQQQAAHHFSDPNLPITGRTIRG